MHFHKWTKWKTYEQQYFKSLYGIVQYDPLLQPIICMELREKRFCKICNKMQDRKIK